MRLYEISHSFSDEMEQNIAFQAPFTVMVNLGSDSQLHETSWGSEDFKKIGPIETFLEAKKIAEDYVQSYPDAWVIIVDRNENQVLAHIPWSRKANKWN